MLRNRLTETAWDHHSEAYSSLAALIGIAGAKLGFALLDPLAGLVIAGLIMKMALHLMKVNVHILMDGMPDEALVRGVMVTAGTVAGLKGTSTADGSQ
ncbi:MAG: cation transporter [bacterium]